VRKLKGKIPPGRIRRRQEDNIKIDLRETGWSGVDLIGLYKERGHCKHDNEPSGSIKC
jgi:hypothetical protein